MSRIRPRIVVVGLVGGHAFGPEAARALAARGGGGGLAAAVPPRGRLGSRCRRTHPVERSARSAVRPDRRATRVRPRRDVLASGDPGFFGIVRSLGERFGSDAPRRPPGAVIGVDGVRPARSVVGRRRRRVGPRSESRCRGRVDRRRCARPRPVAVLTAPDTHHSGSERSSPEQRSPAVEIDDRGGVQHRRARRGGRPRRPRRRWRPDRSTRCRSCSCCLPPPHDDRPATSR